MTSSEIWQRIAPDSTELADRIDREFRDLFASLGRMPRQSHTRKDLTNRPVLFFPLYSFLVVYQPDAKPVRIMAVLRGRRNVKRVLKQRALAAAWPGGKPRRITNYGPASRSF